MYLYIPYIVLEAYPYIALEAYPHIVLEACQYIVLKAYLHALPSIESRMSFQSVYPYCVWTW